LLFYYVTSAWANFRWIIPQSRVTFCR